MPAKSFITTIFLFSISFMGLAADPVDLELNLELGSFDVDAGAGREGNKITVFYYKPESFNADSKIVMAFADRDREGDMARNRWVAAAKKYNLLILSPTYTADVYPTSVNYDSGSIVTVVEDEYVPIEDQSQWIFADFDRIFDLVVDATGSNQSHYDFFGHGASGELAHRLVMFYPDTKASRIVAANASWYTVPDFSSLFPYGLQKGPIATVLMAKQLESAFAKKLIVMLGENDDETEFRGWFRRDKLADMQGTHRLERGRYFYEQSAAQASAINAPFEWTLHRVANVGHSPTRMSIAAAEFLYGD
jgi:hypothetical protein